MEDVYKERHQNLLPVLNANIVQNNVYVEQYVALLDVARLVLQLVKII